ncbi:hypothetical protein KFK14_23335 [Sphingobium phenoxybenzoativorans]|uniref:Uncharacterized protein n=1 Tax=Sphingobium phenoxybenzoativorans TaxID=1592790 RepID=A0A975Q1N0_9SPHN|nr:hypothetical protein [Sphingobium phenoxybenzoativorans]QUT05831.1 hypothetical protein KFK14_23335 [Sphingobium phenoxybenzoativorans]
MFKNIDEQDRWIKLRQQLLSAIGPVERIPSEWKALLETLTANAAPRRTYRFGRHVNRSAIPPQFARLGTQISRA